MTSVYDTIKRLSDSVELQKIYIKSNIDNTLTSCNTLYLRNGLVVTDPNGNEYTVSEVSINGSFVVTPVNGSPNDFSGDYVIIEQAVTFLAGKPKTTNSEWQKISNDSDLKLPLMWLLTGSTENFQSQNASQMVASNIVIYFLDSANTREWLVEEHYNIAIKMMRNIVERFRAVVDKDSKLTRNSYTVRDWEKFGRENVSGAHDKIIDADLSGCEVVLGMNIGGINCNC